MTAGLTSTAPAVLARAMAGSILLRALRRRQPRLVPAYARRREEQAQQPQQGQQRPRGCNW